MADEPQGSEIEEQDKPQPESPENQSGSQDETPAPEATEASEPTTDWEQRYKDTQAAYTQTQQFQSALQGNLGPQAQAQAFAQLGYELPEEEPEDDEYVDEEDRIARLEQALAQRDEREQFDQAEAAEVDWLSENIDALEKKEGIQLSEHALSLVVPAAISNRLQDGQPDLDGAWQAYQEAMKADRAQWMQSKKAPKVPAGGAGDEKLDTSDTAEALRQAMEQTMAADEVS